MDIFSMSNLVTPLLKDFLKKEKVDLFKEMQSIEVLVGGLDYSIEVICDFKEKYLDKESYEEILNEKEDFSRDFVKVITIVKTSQLCFSQFHLGILVSKSMERLEKNMLKIVDSISSYNNLSVVFKKIDEGEFVSIEEARPLLLRDIGVIEVQRDHWLRLLNKGGKRGI